MTGEEVRVLAKSTRLGMLRAHDCPARRLSRMRSGKCLETLRPGTGAKPEVIHLGRSTTDSCGVCRYVYRKRHASLELSQEEAFALPHSASPL